MKRLPRIMAFVPISFGVVATVLFLIGGFGSGDGVVGPYDKLISSLGWPSILIPWPWRWGYARYWNYSPIQNYLFAVCIPSVLNSVLYYGIGCLILGLKSARNAQKCGTNLAAPDGIRYIDDGSTKLGDLRSPKWRISVGICCLVFVLSCWVYGKWVSWWEDRGRWYVERRRAEWLLQDDPNNTKNWNILALARYHTGDKKGSLAARQHSWQLDPTNIDLYSGVAYGLCDVGRIDEAEVAFSNILVMCEQRGHPEWGHNASNQLLVIRRYGKRRHQGHKLDE